MEMAVAMARRGVAVYDIIGALLRIAGYFIAGGAKPGREAQLVDSSIAMLRIGVDDAHDLATERGLRLDGRDA
jgi:hypothetical protein